MYFTASFWLGEIRFSLDEKLTGLAVAGYWLDERMDLMRGSRFWLSRRHWMDWLVLDSEGWLLVNLDRRPSGLACCWNLIGWTAGWFSRYMLGLDPQALYFQTSSNCLSLLPTFKQQIVTHISWWGRTHQIVIYTSELHFHHCKMGVIIPATSADCCEDMMRE